MASDLTLYDSSGDPVDVHGPKRFIDPETGEEVTLQSVEKRYHGEKHFWKMYLFDFLNVLGIIDSKQLDVVCYVMQHTSPYDNRYVGTVRSTAEGAGVSASTVNSTFQKLQGCNFMRRVQNGVYAINPSVMVQGSEAKRRGLLVSYYASDDRDVIEEARAEGCLPSDEDGQALPGDGGE